MRLPRAPQASYGSPPMIIAFCTTCMNRRWQMERTLPHNLEALRGTPHYLALCNYNSGDGLDELVRQEYASAITDGRLTYFHTTTPRVFHSPKAKNTAHRLGLRRRPDILFNLDADAFIEPETVALVLDVLSDPGRVLHNFSGEIADGSFGRIAMWSSVWIELGGYDETFLGMAWQDTDLLYRARGHGLRYELRPEGARAIPNSVEQKMENLALSEETRNKPAFSAFADLIVHNFCKALGRPRLLDWHEHERYAGVLDLEERCTL
jgi:hypothetical protein